MGQKTRVSLTGAVAALILSVATSAQCLASPCDGVDRSLSPQRKAILEPSIAKQLGVRSTEVLESFRADKWTILLVGAPQADDLFLFYSQSPIDHHYITLWAGAAREDEEDQIRTWVLQNAKGIPNQLASCFAWHVTNDSAFRNWPSGSGP